MSNYVNFAIYAGKIGEIIPTNIIKFIGKPPEEKEPDYVVDCKLGKFEKGLRCKCKGSNQFGICKLNKISEKNIAQASDDKDIRNIISGYTAQYECRDCRPLPKVEIFVPFLLHGRQYSPTQKENPELYSISRELENNDF